jgi:hypothetical protein
MEDVRVENELAKALIRPSAMYEKKLRQKAELTDSDVCRSRSLKTFDSGNADTDMRSLNHGNIIGSVSDC